MKKTYMAPTTLCVELRANKMMALSVTDQTIDSGNMDQFDQDSREDNTVNNRNSVWDNIW